MLYVVGGSVAYPQWAGCWQNLDHILHVADHPILEVDKADREEILLKCAVACLENGSNIFALQSSNCFIGTVESEAEFAINPTYSCGTTQNSYKVYHFDNCKFFFI